MNADSVASLETRADREEEFRSPKTSKSVMAQAEQLQGGDQFRELEF